MYIPTHIRQLIPGSTKTGPRLLAYTNPERTKTDGANSEFSGAL